MSHLLAVEIALPTPIKVTQHQVDYLTAALNKEHYIPRDGKKNHPVTIERMEELGHSWMVQGAITRTIDNEWYVRYAVDIQDDNINAARGVVADINSFIESLLEIKDLDFITAAVKQETRGEEVDHHFQVYCTPARLGIVHRNRAFSTDLGGATICRHDNHAPEVHEMRYELVKAVLVANNIDPETTYINEWPGMDPETYPWYVPEDMVNHKFNETLSFTTMTWLAERIEDLLQEGILKTPDNGVADDILNHLLDKQAIKFTSPYFIGGVTYTRSNPGAVWQFIRQFVYIIEWLGDIDELIDPTSDKHEVWLKLAEIMSKSVSDIDGLSRNFKSIVEQQFLSQTKKERMYNTRKHIAAQVIANTIIDGVYANAGDWNEAITADNLTRMVALSPIVAVALGTLIRTWYNSGWVDKKHCLGIHNGAMSKLQEVYFNTNINGLDKFLQHVY